MAVAFTTLAASGLVLNHFAPPSRSAARMALVDDFSISKVIKDVRVFDGDYAEEVRAEVAAVASACIAEKGSFSLCIPGGSVVVAIGGFEADAFDFSKTHVFFANEKIPSYPCIEQAKASLGGKVPEDQIYFVGEGSAAEVAASYTEVLKSHPSIDNSAPIPSFDMMLLGTGPDGHCGCIFPDSAEVKATGSGKVVVAGNDDRADGDFVAITMDVMCAAKVVLVSAAGSGRAPMVASALSGEFGPYDCPAGMVDAAEDTVWFVDSESIADFDASGDDEEEE